MAHTPFVIVSWEAAEASDADDAAAEAEGTVGAGLSGGWALSAAFRTSEWISSDPCTTRTSNDQTGTPVPESDDSRGLKETNDS